MIIIFDDTFGGTAALSEHLSDAGYPWELIGIQDGAVSNGLTNPHYPDPGPQFAATTLGPDVGPGFPKVYVTCVLDIVTPPTPGNEARVAFGLREHDDGVVFGPTIDVENATAKFYGSGAEVSLWPGIELGVNNIVLTLDIGTRNGTLTINGLEVYSGIITEYETQVIDYESAAYLMMTSQAPCVVRRLTVSTDDVSTPEFWTNIIRAAETP